jgi:hypothetical protein
VIWPDKVLTLKTHYHTRLRKARRAEAQVQALCRGQGLSSGLVQRIQVAAVQAVALYRAELWWQGQKDQLRGIKLMVNRQARVTTSMLRITPLGPLIKEAGLYPTEALLDRRQRYYTLRDLGLPTGHPAREVLPVSFCERDQHAQSGVQHLEDLAWVEGPRARGSWSLGQNLAAKLASILKIDPSAGFEEVVQAFPIMVPSYHLSSYGTIL